MERCKYKACHTSWFGSRLSSHNCGLPTLLHLLESPFARRCLRKHENAYKIVLSLLDLVETVLGMEHDPQCGPSAFLLPQTSTEEAETTSTPAKGGSKLESIS